VKSCLVLHCSLVKEHLDVITRRTVVLRGLPVYLNEDGSEFFKTWNVSVMHTHFQERSTQCVVSLSSKAQFVPISGERFR